MSSVGSLLGLYYGYPKTGVGIAQNDYVIDNGYGIQVAFPGDCVTEAGRKMYAKCLFEYVATQNHVEGGSSGSHSRVGITTSNPRDNQHGVAGGTCVVYRCRPKKKVVEVRIAWDAYGSLSHLAQAIEFANANWRKPHQWKFLPSR